MPTDRKRIAKASKRTPDRLMLREGEMWAMMDSGAGVPGINVVKHCPELAFALKEAVRRKRCICANGGEMLVDKEIKLNVELDGHAMPIKFSELPVQCPILSVRRIARKGNDIVFTEDVGYIEHRTSGRRIVFTEREGVYFVRMRITGPDSSDQDPAGFARQGN